VRGNRQTGGSLDLRVIRTERSYKLRTTLLAPEVIRATTRLAQITEGLFDLHTRALVVDAEAAQGRAVLVELEAREGSGLIPLVWTALLQLHSEGVEASGSVRGTSIPECGMFGRWPAVSSANTQTGSLGRSFFCTPMMAGRSSPRQMARLNLWFGSIARLEKSDGRYQDPSGEDFPLPRVGEFCGSRVGRVTEAWEEGVAFWLQRG
jgi:hypothetical protein